jgi:ribosome-associated protein
MADELKINDDLTLGGEYLQFQYSRSGGPGGQNVNKLSTKVTLFFNIADCDDLNEQQKTLIGDRLSTRINKDGLLRVTCQKYRSQKANREEATARLVNLIAKALTIQPARTKTKVPKAVKRKRLENKKHHGELKQLRRKNIDLDD